jgi:hypothetical protein
VPTGTESVLIVSCTEIEAGAIHTIDSGSSYVGFDLEEKIFREPSCAAVGRDQPSIC